MTLPVAFNPISLGQIQTEFGGANPIGLSEYYGATTGIPVSPNPISLGNFHGKSALTVTITGSSQGSFALAPADAYCSINIDANGKWYKGSGSGYANGALALGTWLTAGANTAVWVQMVLTSGTLSSTSGTGRLATSTTRKWGVAMTGTGVKTAGFTLNFYNAATGGTLLASAAFTVDAEASS